jgi:hypothetical protein
MPDRFTDICAVNSSGNIILPPVITSPFVFDPIVGTAAPTLTQRYFTALQQGYVHNGQGLPSLPPAQCLYMVVMSDSEAAHEFAADEIGTVDPSGLPVFLDAWGHPILYIRWPVGFLPPGNPINSAIRCDTDTQTGNTTTDHDPFDPHGAFTDAYAVYPLIYSAGPDGMLGINVGADNSKNPLAYPWGHGGQPHGQLDGSGNFDPYQTDMGALLAGQPNGTLSHYDNIHNQHVEAK